MRLFLRRIHFVGIGGAGMSPLAEIMHTWGLGVSGSDRQRTPLTERLMSLGIDIQYSHDPLLLKDADIVVFSSAIRADNPEMIYARENGLKLVRRAEMLGDLMRSRFCIAVAGTHGKTTTTALTGHIFSTAGHDPIVLVGGTLRDRGSNAVIGNGSVLVAEADEYDRSFLAMYPGIAIITNIDADHLDCYRDLAEICEAFIAFAKRTPFYGAVILCADDPGAAGIMGEIDRTVITYGVNTAAAYRAENVRFADSMTHFAVRKAGAPLGEFAMPLVGSHNVRNALAAIAAASEMGIGPEAIGAALTSFAGVKRRFEILGAARGITVVDDYAHHPAEIQATLAGARQRGFGRVIAVFQPHLYSRTRDFMADFATSLAAADAVFVNAIYKAREEPIPGVTAEGIVEEIKRRGHGCALYVERKESIAGVIATMAREGDCIILMGAGDISEIGGALLERIGNA
jgi:UDP-N-acetylmuramate--alanine ligase